ncbi:hypothetical protein FQZ97_537650 [compost metagenome]
MIAAQLAQIEVERQLGVTQFQRIGDGDQLVQRDVHVVGRIHQHALGQVQHLAAAAQFGEGAEHGGQFARQVFGQLGDFIHRLALQGVEQAALDFAGEPRGPGQATVDADMTEIHVHVRHGGQFEHFQHQADDFHVAGRAGVAIELRTQLDRAARGGQRARLGMQHAAGIAQAIRTFAAQGVGVDTCHLRRDVGAEPHQMARLRVGHLEGTQIEVLAGASQQGLEIFNVRSDHEVVAPTLEQVQHLAASCLDACRLGRQYFFDTIWQQPAIYRCHFANPLSAGRQAISEADTGGRSPATCWTGPSGGDGGP